jgi:hypothetical protein
MKPAYSGTILLHFLDDGAINVFDLKRGRCVIAGRGPKRPASSETSSTQSTVGWFPLLEPVAALGVHQLVSHAGEGGNFRFIRAELSRIDLIHELLQLVGGNVVLHRFVNPAENLIRDCRPADSPRLKGSERGSCQVKVERSRQKQISGPPHEVGFGILRTLSRWGACYPENKARKEAELWVSNSAG